MNVKIFRRLTCLLCLFLPCVVNAAFSSSSNTESDVNTVNKNIQTNEEDQKTADPEITISIDKEDYTKMPLPYTTLEKDVNKAKDLKPQGANTNAKDKSKNNALHLFPTSLSTVDVFKYWGIEPEDSSKEISFLWRAKEGNLEEAKELRERGADVKTKNKNNDNALHYACAYSGSVKMVEWLLDVCKINLESKGVVQRTPFLCAVGKGHLAIAELLKSRGANIHAKDKHGNNALHWNCIFSGNVKMLTWLLDVCGLVDLETKGSAKRTPFLFTAERGQLPIAKLLRQRGADINAKDKCGNNALHLACAYSGSLKMVEWLLDVCVINLESKGFAERRPFLFAAEGGQLGIAKLLKERGANIHAKDKCGNNALHYARSFSGSVEMVTWLLNDCKINLESKGQYQGTPFLCAASKGQLAIAKLLRQRGANINAKDEDGDNALHLACLWSGSEAMITWLLDVCNIDIERKGYAERTPFLFATEGGQLTIARLLRQRGANIYAKDESDNNALDLAKRYDQNQEIINWLSDECKLQETTWLVRMFTWIGEMSAGLFSFIY